MSGITAKQEAENVSACHEKNGVISHEIALPLKILIPIAAIELHEEYSRLFKTKNSFSENLLRL